MNNNDLKVNADNGDVYSQLILGGMYQYGTVIKKNIEEAHKYLLLAATHDEEFSMGWVLDAKIALGHLYVTEYNDKISAMKLFKEVTYSDPPKYRCGLEHNMRKGLAYYNLGHIYSEQGKYMKAFNRYLYATKCGYTDAYHCLGDLYINENYKVDYNKAMYYWKRAIFHGDHSVLLNIALLYKNGHGVKCDKKKAIKYLLLALDHGYIEAMTLLCEIHNLPEFTIMNSLIYK